MRRRQKHPTRWNWGQRRGRPWTTSDVECARFLRHCGLTDKDIGEVLKRTEAAIIAKIGYAGSQPYYANTTTAFYESARPTIGRTWGNLADEFPCVGTA